jgi:peptide/nickel transport system substrate-binding protein
MGNILKLKSEVARSRLLVLLAIGLVSLIIVGTSTASEDDDEVSIYTIAGEDSGFPAPYSHYPRGGGYVYMSFIFDTLVWKNEAGYVPALAESWEMEGDVTYVFHLRDNVTWNDGEEFTADDVVFTIDYTRDHPYIWASTAMVERAEKVNDFTVKMHLKEPYAPFIDEVGGTLPILPEHVYKDVDDPQSFQDYAALTGTGPYVLADYNKVQESYRFIARDNYYGGSPRVRELRVVKVSSEMAPAALAQGDIDASSITQEMIKPIEDKGFSVLTSSANGWGYKLMINHQKDPMSDKRFRQALAYAIDRERLVEIVGRGRGLVGNQGSVPPYHSWYNPDVEEYQHDPEKSMELLADMGYDGSVVELLTKGGSVEYDRIVELIKDDLEAVGIKVDLRSMDSKTVDSKVSEWNFDLAISGHGGAIGDPNFLAKMNSGWQFNSDRYFEDQELNNLLERQVTETDGHARRKMIDRIQVLYAEDVPAIVLYYPEWAWAHDGQVDLYYTVDGVANGIPIPLNKLAFVGR